MFQRQLQAASRLGKPQWRAMLAYLVGLRQQSIHPAEAGLPYPWEEIGPGYCYRPAFGHWDIIHAGFDSLATEPEHSRQQLANLLSLQREDGFVPGAIIIESGAIRRIPAVTHPPVWIYLADDLARQQGFSGVLRQCYPALCKQIAWFESQRAAGVSPEAIDAPTAAAPAAAAWGFWYYDVRGPAWESGVDEGVRFDRRQDRVLPCVDATSHVHALYQAAARWAAAAGADPAPWQAKADKLAQLIQQRLFDEETGFFHDLWAVNNAPMRRLSFEGIWPLVAGAASGQQAQRVIDENLLHPQRFGSPHPIASVALCDPGHCLRMWRGPAWNSMTFWTARACAAYGRCDAGKRLLEAALDQTARQFQRTGAIWEYYHPLGGPPQALLRKPSTPFNTPCRDYLGHNPLLAMARLWEEL